MIADGALAATRPCLNAALVCQGRNSTLVPLTAHTVDHVTVHARTLNDGEVPELLARYDPFPAQAVAF